MYLCLLNIMKYVFVFAQHYVEQKPALLINNASDE